MLRPLQSHQESRLRYSTLLVLYKYIVQAARSLILAQVMRPLSPRVFPLFQIEVTLRIAGYNDCEKIEVDIYVNDKGMVGHSGPYPQNEDARCRHARKLSQKPGRSLANLNRCGGRSKVGTIRRSVLGTSIDVYLDVRCLHVQVQYGYM